MVDGQTDINVEKVINRKYFDKDNLYMNYKKVYLLLWTSVYLGNGTPNSLIELDLGNHEGDN